MSNTREAGNGNEVRPGWQPWTCWEVVRFSREGEPAEWPQIRRGVRTKGVRSGDVSTRVGHTERASHVL